MGYIVCFLLAILLAVCVGLISYACGSARSFEKVYEELQKQGWKIIDSSGKEWTKP